MALINMGHLMLNHLRKIQAMEVQMKMKTTFSSSNNIFIAESESDDRV